MKISNGWIAVVAACSCGVCILGGSVLAFMEDRWMSEPEGFYLSVEWATMGNQHLNLAEVKANQIEISSTIARDDGVLVWTTDRTVPKSDGVFTKAALDISGQKFIKVHEKPTLLSPAIDDFMKTSKRAR